MTTTLKRSLTTAFATDPATDPATAAGAEEFVSLSMEQLRKMTAEQLKELNIKQLEELKAMNDVQLENLKVMGMEKLQELKTILVQEMDAAHNEVCKMEDDWFHAPHETRTAEAEEKKKRDIELLEERIKSISSTTNAIRRAYIELRDKRTDDAIEAHAAKKLKSEKAVDTKSESKGEEAGVEKTETEKTETEKKQEIIAAMKLFGLAKLDEMTREIDRQKLKLADKIWDLREEWKDSLDEKEEAGAKKAGAKEAGAKKAGAKEAGAKKAGAKEAGAKKVKATMSPKDYEKEIKTLQDKICWFSKEEDNLWEAIFELKKEVKRELFPQ